MHAPQAMRLQATTLPHSHNAVLLSTRLQVLPELKQSESQAISGLPEDSAHVWSLYAWLGLANPLGACSATIADAAVCKRTG